MRLSPRQGHVLSTSSAAISILRRSKGRSARVGPCGVGYRACGHQFEGRGIPRQAVYASLSPPLTLPASR